MPSAYVPVGQREIVCAECGEKYTAKSLCSKYCGRPCARKAQAKKPGKPCKQDGCSKKQRARGLCSTHYNQTLPGRHKKIEVPCARCGKPALKEQQTRYALRYCGDACRDLHWSERARLRHSQVEVWKPRPLWHTAHDAYQPAKRSTRVFISTKCVICGAMFLDLYGAKTCGDRCGDIHRRGVRSEHEHRRRARKVAAFVAPVYRQRIFERDNYTCQLCLQPIAMDKRAPHPQSPSIDHIIALANGGTHEPNNVQAAHWLCNAIKGDREWVTTA